MSIDPTVAVPDEQRRFSVRLPRPLWIGVAGVMILVAATLLTTGLRLHRQISAIDAIESQGGAVGTVRHRSAWQRNLLGHPTYRAFEVVEFVNWENGRISDADLVQLLELPTLRRLNLRHTRITDAGIMRLKELPHLELVLLEGTEATDAGIAELQRAAPSLTIHK